MTSEAQQKSLASTLLFGFLGAGLIYYSRRNKGLLATVSATAGYSLLTKAVSTTLVTALARSSD